MTLMGTDQAGTTHILSPSGDGFWAGLCGYQTGPPEYETQATHEQVSHLLAIMERGCVRCMRKTAFQPTGTGGRP